MLYCKIWNRNVFFLQIDNKQKLQETLTTLMISEEESARRTRWLDTFVIASATHYACWHTPHLKQLLSTGQPCCLSAVINGKSLKNGKYIRETFEKKGYWKHSCSEWGHCWISCSFFTSVSNHPRCFVSQESWDLSLKRKLLLQQPHPTLQTSKQPSRVCASLCVRELQECWHNWIKRHSCWT